MSGIVQKATPSLNVLTLGAVLLQPWPSQAFLWKEFCLLLPKSLFTEEDSGFFFFSSSKEPLCTNSHPPTVHVNYSSVMWPLWVTLILPFPWMSEEQERSGGWVTEHLDLLLTNDICGGTSELCRCAGWGKEQRWGILRCHRLAFPRTSECTRINRHARLLPHDQNGTGWLKAKLALLKKSIEMSCCGVAE